MPGVKTDIYQPIAGSRDLDTLSNVQDLNNRAVFGWLDRITRLFICKTTDPGVGNDSTEGITPPAIWINTATNTAFINVDNSAGAAVWVSVAGGAGAVADRTSQLVYGTVTPAASAITTVVTVSPGSDTHITSIECSGELFGKFELVENSTVVGTKRTGPQRNVIFDFDVPWTIASGDTLDVKVVHENSGKTPKFEVGVWGFT